MAVLESDEAVAYFFSQLKLPPTAIDELRTILAQGPCFDQSSIDEASKRDIASIDSVSLHGEGIFLFGRSQQRHPSRTPLR